MTRFPSISKFASAPGSIAWGKNLSALAFAVLLIVCSIAVGCSSEKPKPANSNSQMSTMPSPAPSVAANLPTPMPEPAAKPAPKKVVKKRPATVTYSDKNSGVSFEYPRRYAIETGDAAGELVATSPLPSNFVAPGGMALAAVELPETSFANTDFSSAYFNVSVHKGLTSEQCSVFAVPQPKVVPATDAPAQTPASTSTTEQSASSTSTTPAPSASEPQGSKLMIGDLELRGTEAVSGEGTRQSDAKYYHVFQNGSCYEFALNVTTVARENEGGMKHVDRDKVFDRLEKILATVKINPVVEEPAAAPATTASVPTTPEVSDKPQN